MLTRLQARYFVSITLLVEYSTRPGFGTGALFHPALMLLRATAEIACRPRRAATADPAGIEIEQCVAFTANADAVLRPPLGRHFKRQAIGRFRRVEIGTDDNFTRLCLWAQRRKPRRHRRIKQRRHRRFGKQNRQQDQ